MFNRHTTCRAAAGLFCLAALAGCADDSAPARPAPSITNRVAYAPPRPAAPPLFASTSPPATDSSADPLLAPNGLLDNAGDSKPNAGAIVPLSGPLSAPPAAEQDALASAPDTLAGQAPGIHMPTEHSHWLVGPIFNARVGVRVNGLFLGTYMAPQDRDITMKLHSGINTVTLAYTPLTSTASAHLDILESEHTPPIAPLASFRSPPSDLSAHTPQTVTQTLTFLAH